MHFCLPPSVKYACSFNLTAPDFINEIFAVRCDFTDISNHGTTTGTFRNQPRLWIQNNSGTPA